MKNLKLFPKIFICTFSILTILLVIVHFSIYIIFPETYLESRKREISKKADEFSARMDGKTLAFVKKSIDIYSDSSDTKATIQGRNRKKELHIDKKLDIDLKSQNNSLIIEDRTVKLDSGKKISIQFMSNADMKGDARKLSLKFLPYSLMISFAISLLFSLVLAKIITRQIREIRGVTQDMMMLEREAILTVDSNDEVGELKSQINSLYSRLLEVIDDLELKNAQIVRLERLKYDFFRGRSHELKTPLAGLKIILENMKYDVGKYKDKEKYIGECIEIVDELTSSIAQMLALSSFEDLEEKREMIELKDAFDEVIAKYLLLATQKDLKIENRLEDEKISIEKTALNLVISNLISNAVKYAEKGGIISIEASGSRCYVENSYLADSNILEKSVDFSDNSIGEAGYEGGVGLFIVRRILENYNIEHEMTIEDGSAKFSFRIGQDVSCKK